MSESDLNLIKNNIAPAMGFYIDFDNSINNNWIRFQLNKTYLDERNLRWIVYVDEDFNNAIKNGANILFKAGQKENITNSNKFTEL